MTCFHSLSCVCPYGHFFSSNPDWFIECVVCVCLTGQSDTLKFGLQYSICILHQPRFLSSRESSFFILVWRKKVTYLLYAFSRKKKDRIYLQNDDEFESYMITNICIAGGMATLATPPRKCLKI